jgi:hypothetical protein
VQRRYTDRGRPYDHEAWRTLYEKTGSTGIYSGFDLTPGTVGNQIVAAVGALLLPTGIVVVETASTTIEIADGTSFPPSSAKNYTVATRHEEADNGLIGGEAMTYYVAENTLMTTQPSDGVVVGWIRHPGGGLPLIQEYITNAPKHAPLILVQDYVARLPVKLSPPTFPHGVYGQGVVDTSGYDSSKVWTGFTNTTDAVDPATGVTPIVTLYQQFPIYNRPYQIELESIIPTGDAIAVTLYDTAGAVSVTDTLSGNATFTRDTIEVPQSGGTWTSGSLAVLKVVITVAINTTVKLSDLEIDFWPYAFPRVG